MSKALVVVDMQNDFVIDALRNEEGIKIVPNVVYKVKDAIENGVNVIFTRDTHFDNYMETQEGKHLPVIHCIKDTKGWEIIDDLKPFVDKVIDKPTFGSVELAEELKKIDNLEEVELIGLCTDICVISNALLVKANFPNIPIKVDASCCAGVTPESHENALKAMKSCHIDIVNE